MDFEIREIPNPLFPPWNESKDRAMITFSSLKMNYLLSVFFSSQKKKSLVAIFTLDFMKIYAVPCRHHKNVEIKLSETTRNGLVFYCLFHFPVSRHVQQTPILVDGAATTGYIYNKYAI